MQTSIPSSIGETTLKGLAVAGGIAKGCVVVIDPKGLSIPQHKIAPGDVASEIDRLNSALVLTRGEIRTIQDRVSKGMGDGEAGLFEAHLLVLEDVTLLAEVQRSIENKHFNAEFAFHSAVERYAQVLSQAEDRYLAERASDLRDVSTRVLGHLLGHRDGIDPNSFPVGSILIAHDLSPSVTAQLDPKKVSGFATEAGGQNSHTAILARKLGIPAVVGINDLLRLTPANVPTILDGFSGLLITNPSDQTLFTYGLLQKRSKALGEKLKEIRDQPAVTLDGQRIDLRTNIDLPSDTPSALASGADGVGLFRTEYLFLSNSPSPDEDHQVKAYVEVLTAFLPSPVVLRTLDLGGDKLPDGGIEVEPNPFLGWRAIRISLDRRDIFRTQIRALLRASKNGRAQILLPMISSLDELLLARELIDGYRRELVQEGHTVGDCVEVGVMIEIPSAAIMAVELAKHADFFSIGTNDLTQYTLAVDRLNERVAHLYQPTHPAVLRLIRQTVAAARDQGIPVAICGEMAGDPEVVPLLVGLGIRELSATPGSIPSIKYMIRHLRYAEAVALAEETLTLNRASDILALTRKFARRIAPELFLNKLTDAP